MNGYSLKLLDVVAQIRTLTSLAGNMNNHGPLFETMAKDLEVVVMAIESGLISPIRDAEDQTLRDARAFVREGRKLMAESYHPDSWKLRELNEAADWLAKLL